MALSCIWDAPSEARISGKIKSVTPTCERCGTTEIVRNARLIWSTTEQKWVLGKVFYGFVCLNCEDATNAKWI